MQKLWCWRCKKEVGMLDEKEFAIASELYGKLVRTLSDDRIEIRQQLIDYYFNLTGERDLNPNSIIHHRIAMYGPPCENCGKPYRTKHASFCADCGNKRDISS